MTKGERMRGLHADPAFAAGRDERARQLFRERHPELQRKSNARRRGVDVPPELEEAWRACKRKRMTNAEAAKFLGLKFKPKTRRKRRKKKPEEAGE